MSVSGNKGQKIPKSLKVRIDAHKRLDHLFDEIERTGMTGNVCLRFHTNQGCPRDFNLEYSIRDCNNDSIPKAYDDGI